MQTKIHINLTQGILEVEGESDFVRDIYNDFKSELSKHAMQKQQVHTNENRHPSYVRAINTFNTEIPANSESNLIPTKKKAKRSGNRAPKGHSCADRITILRTKGFFKSPKTPKEIVQGLAKEGWTHKNNQVAAAAVDMFNRGQIQRTSAGNGFTYFWDRD